MNNKCEKKISIITPSFNQEKYIGRCIRSILDQSIDKSKYELILINDGSDDKTGFAMNLFVDPFKDNVKILENDINKGLPYSLNKGINESKGEYIVRVDSDDFVNKNFLLFLESYLDFNPEVNAVACDFNLVDDQGLFIKRVNCEEMQIGCGIMFRRESLYKIGLYDEKLHFNEEKDLRIRYEKEYHIARLALPLYRYRRHETNMTNDLEKKNLYDNLLLKKHY